MKIYDFQTYKKITCMSVNTNNDGKIVHQNKFLEIEHLNTMLNDKVNMDQSISFFKDSEDQIILIQESKQKELMIFKMRGIHTDDCIQLDQDNGHEEQLNINLKDGRFNQVIRDEICNIENQTAQGLQGTRKQEVSITDNLTCDVCDNDHDEPYVQHKVNVKKDDKDLLEYIDKYGQATIQLSSDEKKNHVFIDDFDGNKKKVKTYLFYDQQQLRLIFYQQSNQGQYALFIFAIYNPDTKCDIMSHQD